MTPGILALLLAGCLGEASDTGTNACRTAGTEEVDLDLELAGDLGRIPARVVAVPGGDPASSPVVVMIPGRWYSTTRPEEGNTPVPGSVVLRVALAAETWADGQDDVRGAIARAAIAAALRYARGDDDDAAGCRLRERFPRADPDAVVLVGQSNGGNLAAATLADLALDVPEPAGLVTWETPAGAQFADMEFGTVEGVYDPGACSLSAEGVVCGYREGVALAADGDTVCFDLDRNGHCGANDVRPHAPIDPVTGRYAGSPQLAEALLAAGLDPGWDTPEDARRFWASRDIVQAAPGVVARFPSLPFLLLASETDHALPSLADHPHVYALGEALQAAGAGWVRLNPGAAYTGLDDENAANLPLRLNGEGAWLLSEADEDPVSVTYAAAVAELR